MKTTSILLLSPLLPLAFSIHDPAHTTECKTTKSDTHTYTFGVSDTTAYAITVEHQTRISPCAPTPTVTAFAAGEEAGWEPYTATQILTRYISYNASASREPTSTTVTNTWLHFPVAEPYAALADLRENCNCSSSLRSKTEDNSCKKWGLKTKCGVQCGSNDGQFTCLVESTNEREYLEGRICAGRTRRSGEWEDKLVHLGEPCHVGDVVNDCSICFDN